MQEIGISSNSTLSRRQQAVNLFEQVLHELVSEGSDVSRALMLSFHACQLAGSGWEQPLAWFEQEMSGYAAGASLPDYRRQISGSAHWELISPNVSQYHRYLLEQSREPSRVITEDCFVGMSLIKNWSVSGLMHRIGEPRMRFARTSNNIELGAYQEAEIANFHPDNYRRIITHVESETFKFASRSIVALNYGDSVQSIWELYRTGVDAALTNLGLEEHFKHIDEDIASQNPEKWRGAMWACRDVLSTLGARLWCDPQPVYAALDNMKVTEAHPINRLLAYIHCKNVTGSVHRLLESELERTVSYMHALNDLDSKAHSVEPVCREDALLAVVSTYVLLAQLARRTDLKPVLDQRICGEA